MALKKQSLFLYNYEINSFNASLDFKSASIGPIRAATIPFGSYTLSGLLKAIKIAMQGADPLRLYTVTTDRSLVNGTENRITIQTNGTYLDLLFGTGPRLATSIAPLLGFTTTDKTGALTYTGSTTSGVSLIPELVGYSYLGPAMMRSVFGALNISAIGQKEALVWQVQKFFQVEFRHEPEAKVITEWTDLMTWMIQQKPLEFTPDLTAPATFYECTLESSVADGKGLGYRMDEMLPDFPFEYKTGMMKFRQKV